MKKGKKAKAIVGLAILVAGMICVQGVATAVNSSTKIEQETSRNYTVINKPMPKIGTLAMGGNVLISSDHPDGDDLHPKVAMNSAGTVAVVYEEERGIFEKLNPVCYSDDGGNTWIKQYEFLSEDSGILMRPDLAYCSATDEFLLQSTDPLAESFNMNMYRIPGDIASGGEPSGIGVSGIGAEGYVEGAITYVENWMVGLFCADMAETGPRGLELIYYDEEWASPPNGGFYYDGQMMTTTAPAYNPEMATGAERMYMVMRSDEGFNSKITYKATVTDLDDLWTSGGGPGGMDKYSDIEVWPWQGYVIDSSEKTNVQVADPDVAASGSNTAIVFMTTENIFGDWDIWCAYTSETPGEGSQYTWEFSAVVENHPADEINPSVYMSGNMVFCAYVSNGNLYLVESEDGGATWGTPEQINEVDGTVVAEEAAVDINAGGIVWTDNRDGQKDIYYAPLPTPVINVESITGGMGITATVTNTGTVDATNVPWSIDVSGLVFLGGHTEGTIDLPVGGEATVSSGLVFGIGPGTIVVNAGGASKTASCFVLGPLVLGV